MFQNEKFLGFVHPYNLLECFQSKDIDSKKKKKKKVKCKDVYRRPW